jgi:hypothetical protein
MRSLARQLIATTALLVCVSSATAQAGWTEGFYRCLAKLLGRAESPQAAAYTLAARQGFRDARLRQRAVGDIAKELKRYLASADEGSLIADLRKSTAFAEQDLMTRLMRMSPEPKFESRFQAMNALGLRSDRRTVDILFDLSTGAIEAAYLAGYHDAGRLSDYGLASQSRLNLREPLPDGQGFSVLYRWDDRNSPIEARYYFIFAEKPGAPWVKKSLVQLHHELFAQADKGLYWRLIDRLRPKLERRYGWDAYFTAYNQFVTERGAVFDRYADDLVYLPGPTPDSLRVQGSFGRNETPQQVVARFTPRTDLVWSELEVGEETFSVVLRLPNPGRTGLSADR